MRLRRQRAATGTETETTKKPTRPAWQELLDSPERPTREDLAEGHDIFVDSALEPVPAPRWMRGRRRARRDRLS